MKFSGLRLLVLSFIVFANIHDAHAMRYHKAATLAFQVPIRSFAKTNSLSQKVSNALIRNISKQLAESDNNELTKQTLQQQLEDLIKSLQRQEKVNEELHVEVATACKLETVLELLERGAELRSFDENGITALDRLAKTGNEDLVQKALERELELYI